MSEKDRVLIKGMISLMKTKHGHSDMIGLFADRASGVPLNELLKQECIKCGTPRNKKSKEEDA